MALLPDPRQNFQLPNGRKVILYLHCWSMYIKTLLFQRPRNWPNFHKSGLIEPSLIWPLVCCSVHGQGSTLKQVVLIWMKNKPFNWIKSPNHCYPIANFKFNISIKGLKNHQSVDVCMYTKWPAIQRWLSRKQRQVGWRQGGWMATGHTQDAQPVLLSPFPLWGHCVHWVCSKFWNCWPFYPTGTMSRIHTFEKRQCDRCQHMSAVKNMPPPSLSLPVPIPPPPP